ncbi:MAG TPA: succinate dehydrogenase [Chloroflexota bacterium]|nr:succinate dehydrogenase [Chloroflexota bacterium]
MTTATRTAQTAHTARTTREFYSWYFFRVSGLLLVVLALGHFLLMHAIHSILDVDYSFVVRRWAQVSWRVYDWLLLVLALLHGFNGLRVVVNEHVRWEGVRRAAQGLVVAATLLFLILGTYVLVAFAPSQS